VTSLRSHIALYYTENWISCNHWLHHRGIWQQQSCISHLWGFQTTTGRSKWRYNSRK